MSLNNGRDENTGTKVSPPHEIFSGKYLNYDSVNELLDFYRPSIRNIKKKLPGSFIVVSFAVSSDGYSSKGHYYKNLISDAFKNSSI